VQLARQSAPRPRVHARSPDGVQLARLLGSRHLGHAATRAARLGDQRQDQAEAGARGNGRRGASPAAQPRRSGRQCSRSKSEAASCVLRRGLGLGVGRSLAWGWAAAGRRRANVASGLLSVVGLDFLWAISIENIEY
jgi:hypothetical protein